MQPDREVHRHIGVNDSMTLEELSTILQICFDLDREAPCNFGEDLDCSRAVAGLTEFTFTWGLWEFHLRAVDVYPRDEDTPRALCVGGSGSFPGSHFDLTAINAELTGEDTIHEVLNLAAPDVRRIIERTKLFDFVPLLQALDLNRDVELAAEDMAVLDSLPREVTSEGADAFWVTIMGLACLAGQETTDSVISTTFDALGWVDDDGQAMDPEEIRSLCAASLDQLEKLGVYGAGAVSPVERLDFYRALLRGAV